MNVLIFPAWYDKNDQYQGSFIKEQAIALGETGCKVKLLELYFERKFPFKRRIETVQLSENVAILRYHIPIISPVRLANMFYRISRRKISRRLISWIKELEEFDIFHIQSLLHPLMPYMAFQASKVLGKPLALSEHYTSFDSAEKPQGNFYTNDELVHQIVPQTRLRFSPSISATEKHKAYFNLDFEAISPIPSRIYETIPLPSQRQAPESGFAFLCVGNISLRKGHDLLFTAFAACFKGKDKVKLVLAGKITDPDHWKGLIQSLGIESQVELLGAVPPQELIKVFDRSHVLVSPSRLETFGIVVLEGLLRGLPVVAAASGGPEDFVTEACGLICQADNAPDLAKSLAKIHADYTRFDSNKIREYALANFSRKRFAEKLTERFNSIL